MNFETRICQPHDGALVEAAQCLAAGDVVGFPTETVYGLGANALDPGAVMRIFEAKGRPADNPLIVHITDYSQLSQVIDGEMPEVAMKLADAYWPGPLTMLMKKSPDLPDCVTAGLPTVGVRMPAHPVARRLIEAAERPIAAPSANRSGRPSPTTAQHVFEDMDGRIPMIIDGGPCAVGLESTVLDVTCTPPRILRPGGITAEQIAAVAGAVEVDGAVMRPLAEGEKPRSPGMKYRHYAPNGELLIVRGEEKRVVEEISAMYDAAEADGHSAVILALDDHDFYEGRHTIFLGKDETEMAASLFSVLRMADEIGADMLFSEAIPAEGLGLAVMNRLGRAAGFRVLDV